MQKKAIALITSYLLILITYPLPVYAGECVNSPYGVACGGMGVPSPQSSKEAPITTPAEFLASLARTHPEALVQTQETRSPAQNISIPSTLPASGVAGNAPLPVAATPNVISDPPPFLEGANNPLAPAQHTAPDGADISEKVDVGIRNFFDREGTIRLHDYEQSQQVARKNATEAIRKIPAMVQTTAWREITDQAAMLGVDPLAALATVGYDDPTTYYRSHFDPKLADPDALSKNSIEMERGTFDHVKKWFANKNNIKQYKMPASLIVSSQAMKFDGKGKITAGLLLLKRAEFLGDPKNLWGAMYHAGETDLADEIVRTGSTVNKYKTPRPWRVLPDSGMAGQVFQDKKLLLNVHANTAYIDVYNALNEAAYLNTASEETPPSKEVGLNAGKVVLNNSGESVPSAASENSGYASFTAADATSPLHGTPAGAAPETPRITANDIRKIFYPSQGSAEEKPITTFDEFRASLAQTQTQTQTQETRSPVQNISRPSTSPTSGVVGNAPLPVAAAPDIAPDAPFFMQDPSGISDEVNRLTTEWHNTKNLATTVWRSRTPEEREVLVDKLTTMTDQIRVAQRKQTAQDVMWGNNDRATYLLRRDTGIQNLMLQNRSDGGVNVIIGGRRADVLTRRELADRVINAGPY